MMRGQIYGRDTELSVRMFIVMFLLAALYLGFIFVLFYSGLDSFTLAIIAAVMLGAQYFFSDKIVLASMRAQVVTPEQAPDLHGIVDRLVAMADMPKPRLAVVQSSVPNAFATGRNPRNSVVAVTTGLLNRLDQAEVEAVLGHELSHVRNRDAMVLTLASFFATVAFFIMRSGMFYGFGGRRNRDGGALVLIYVASIAVWLISYVLIRALSRYREFAADRGAALITGSPMTLVSALQKISGTMARIPERDMREVQGMNAFFIIPAISGKGLLELFSTHPSLEKRVERLTRLQQQMEGIGPR